MPWHWKPADAPITDPLVQEYTDTIHAFEVLNCKDLESRDYIAFYGGNADGTSKKAEAKEKAQKEVKEITLEEIIIEGYEDRAAKATEQL